MVALIRSRERYRDIADNNVTYFAIETNISACESEELMCQSMEKFETMFASICNGIDVSMWCPISEWRYKEDRHFAERRVAISSQQTCQSRERQVPVMQVNIPRKIEPQWSRFEYIMRDLRI